MKGALAREDRESLESLVAQARVGDREAFDELIRRFEKNVMKTALYLTRNLADAQDIAQEVYIKIFRRLETYQETEKIDRWIYRITVNAARDFQRKKRFWGPLEKIVLFVAPQDSVRDAEIRNRLIDSLAKLSFNERAAFIFKEVREMETAEVAEILQCSQVSVRGYLHNARKKMQKHFRDFREQA